jgi:hypothetical protein
VGVAASAKLFAAGGTWRLAGVPAAGRALLTAAVTGGETERTLAGMLLVQAGDRSVALLTPAILAGETAPVLVDILASIGTDRARDALVTVSRGSRATVTPDTRQAAVEALQTLDAIRARDSGH